MRLREALALAAFVVGVFLVSLIANSVLLNHWTDRDPAPEPTYCHSLTEDGPIVDCDYQGDTNTWEPR